jgi:hypothetical protein
MERTLEEPIHEHCDLDGRVSFEQPLEEPQAHDTMHNSHHLYQPLDHTSKCIRLLTMERDADNSIRCTLRIFPIDESPPFIALSYAWGSPAETRQILLDGKDFTVRENLHAALLMILEKKKDSEVASSRLRAETPSSQWLQSTRKDYMLDKDNWHLFWIDALCVNQENIPERNHQVNMMREIFAGAAFVMVWLGPESVDSNLAMVSLQSSSPDSNLPMDSVQFTSGEPKLSSPAWSTWAEEPKRNAIVSLLKRNYWRRVWIIQEIIKARALLITCGNASLFWSQLDNFVVGLGPIHNHGSAYNIIQERRKNEFETWRRGSPLHTLILRYCRQDCTDPRDRIYGILGLVGDWQRADRPSIQADYALSCDQLFDRVRSHLPHSLSAVVASSELNEQTMWNAECALAEALQLKDRLRDLRNKSNARVSVSLLC